jgi:aspartyl/asparaginyl-tRNA synthetase
MIRTPIAGLRGHVGETVTIAGWAQALRLQRAVQFVVVRDHTGAVQVTHRRDGSPWPRHMRLAPAAPTWTRPASGPFPRGSSRRPGTNSSS